MRSLFTMSILVFILMPATLQAQDKTIHGTVVSAGKPVVSASVLLRPSGLALLTDSLGRFAFHQLPGDVYTVEVSALGFSADGRKIDLRDRDHADIKFVLQASASLLSEVVVSGTMKEVKRMESPVPVEVYGSQYFRMNPTPALFDAMQMVNGVRPQNNCNICNTGDIRINGLDGAYTMVLIDGTPIVSALSTVYGLSGIPNAMIERVEVVKGPASSLYGSEAVAGLINIITKKTGNAPRLSADVFASSWNEVNTELGLTWKAAKKISALSGISYFDYNNPIDHNADGFTDMALQKRISLFQKLQIERDRHRVFSIAGRYVNENRWGGDMRWNKFFRGGDSVYGESIYTDRWEIFGHYQLPVRPKILLTYSFNQHNQDSRYGNVAYLAKQTTAFAQLTWDRKFRKHDLLSGISYRYTKYADNTPATGAADPLKLGNRPQETNLPGLFVQDELTVTPNHKLLLGLRLDHHATHGNIFTPRFAYKWSLSPQSILRLNAGTGFRVVNLFTEDHAALTGSRVVEISQALQPEKSYNINLNWLKKWRGKKEGSGVFELSAWYTRFQNRIIGDYLTDPNKIIYANLNGYAQSMGMSVNLNYEFNHQLKAMIGGTVMNVTVTNDGKTNRQLFAERFSGNWSLSWHIAKLHMNIDYTGSVTGPMALPLLGEWDPRPGLSPVWSLQNIQWSYHGVKRFEIYAGVKNILNWTPDRNTPFLLARTNDPFDKNVQYDTNGNVLRTADNPYALTFDTGYAYAPNQGRRLFAGVRYLLK